MPDRNGKIFYTSITSLSHISKYGGVPTAKRYFGRSRASDGFDALVRAGRAELSMEALAVSAKFNALFTDEEVNTCFELLCGAGYYERK